MKTLVLGASTNKERYSYKAIHNLVDKSHQVVAIGAKKGMAFDIPIETDKIGFRAIDTVTIYLNPTAQEEYYDYVLSLKPRRVIFNPGTENPTFFKLLEANNIQYEVACTLVLLATNQY
ncbi:MAG TPA: CoA-binding protein [Flavobacterium sp.]|uniref:CoA-binding protein n=1 Tax=Flavobacterium sp. TaxID=239 RepID=UPI002B4AE637|nr:CoA-binding protein [Flavobacterium sp.]HLO73786.1 CoA-binding protein [Flavobacterium sp.]